MEDRSGNRLADTIRPNEYDLELEVSLKSRRFSGHVAIDLEILDPTPVIVLHAMDLEIEKASLEIGNKILPCQPSLHPPSETARLEPTEPIGSGPARLSLRFSGTMNSQLRGLYQVIVGEETYAFTQFEPTDARRMFPCFDEPAMKARFRLSVTIPSEYIALSNMPILEEKTLGASKKVIFTQSPIMSSYLLCLGIARFDSRDILVEGTRVSVWTPPSQLELGTFALKVTEAVLPLLNGYFDLPYPYPKLDLVCVPDFAMGAMENWGAIFFRDSRLLVHENSASTSTLRDVANVITHEIVHQWFGNLVTMKWWDDLWLNESFATWLACKIVDQWRPDWNSWVEFQQQKQSPLNIDALSSTRAIQFRVQDSAQIEEMFDPLTYEKGAACLRMMEQFLGEIPFREGIRRYIRKYSYSNAAAEDLWTELEEASGQPVFDIAQDWFTKPGFPLITVRSTHPALRLIEIEQRRFRALPTPNPSPSEKWTVPLTIRYQGAMGPGSLRQIFKEASGALRIPGEGKIDWIYINAGETGFLRTNYDSPLRARILNHALTSLTPEERIGFLDHLWTLCLCGEISIKVFMEALSRFKGDQTRVVVQAMSNYLETLSNWLILDPDRPLFQDFVLTLFIPIWNSLGWDASGGDDDEIRLSRASALWVLGSIAEDEKILSELPRRLTLFWGRSASLEATLVSPVLRLAIRTDGGSLLLPYFEKISLAATPEDRDRYLLALTEYKKPPLARRVLDYVLSDQVRAQDFWRPIRLLLSNPWVQEEAWGFVRNHWQSICQKGGSVAAQRIIQGARYLWRVEWQREVQSFYQNPSHRVPSAQRSLEQTLEFLEQGIRFKEKEQKPLSDWLHENSVSRE